MTGLPLTYPDLIAPLHRMLVGAGFSETAAAWIALVIGVLVLFAGMALLSKVLAVVFTGTLKRVATNTKGHFDDHLLHYHLPRYLARIIPLMLSYHLVPMVFKDLPGWVPAVERLFNIFFIVLFVRIVRAVLRAGRDASKDHPSFRDKPLDS